MCYQNLLQNFSIFLTITKSRLSSSSSINAYWSISSAKLSYSLLIGQEQSSIKNFGGDFGNTFSNFENCNLIYILKKNEFLTKTSESDLNDEPQLSQRKISSQRGNLGSEAFMPRLREHLFFKGLCVLKLLFC